MTRELPIAAIRKSVVVDMPIASAFELFTTGINRWWPAPFSMHAGQPVKQMIIEPRQCGRWYAELEDCSERHIGRVSIWEPPARVVFE
jgi:hypothetical protein